MSNRPGSLVFGIAVGLVVALLSYRWITAPSERGAREQEEAVVVHARTLIAERLGLETPEIVDALAPRRSVGKSYVYPVRDGWELSGYYRRDADDEWHPWLLQLDAERNVLLLRVQDDDPRLGQAADRDPALEVLR